MSGLADRLFEVSEQVRYVAESRDGQLSIHQRPGVENASASESDRYEELFVNPAVLTLTRQRGNVDCGGLDYVLIRYGHFFQFVQPITSGHVSVAIEPGDDPFAVVRAIRGALGPEDLPRGNP